MHRALNYGSLLRLRSQSGSRKNLNDLFRVTRPSQAIELQTTPKPSYKGFNSLHDDLESLTTAQSGNGNYTQASGRRDGDCSRKEPAGTDGIQVTQ